MLPGGDINRQEIKTWNPQLRGIMQTSVSDKKMAITLIREGADDYIVKPLDRPVVMAKLRKLVRDMDGGGKEQNPD